MSVITLATCLLGIFHPETHDNDVLPEKLKSTGEHLGAARFHRPSQPAKRHGFSPPVTSRGEFVITSSKTVRGRELKSKFAPRGFGSQTSAVGHRAAWFVGPHGPPGFEYLPAGAPDIKDLL